MKYDLSVFPAAHAHGGMPSYPCNGPAIIKTGQGEIRELPITTKQFLGKNIIFSGGGYFRLLPYPVIKSWSKDCSDYLLSYIHPRDLDGAQPMLEGLPLTRKFKSYVGTKGAEAKLRKYVKDFKFTDVRTAVEQVDWEKVPVVEL